MDITPEMLSALAGGIIGWLVASSLAARPGVGRKLRLVLLCILVFALMEGGIWAVERLLVRHLDDFFASEAFAFGAIAGAVLWSSARQPAAYRGPPDDWRLR